VTPPDSSPEAPYRGFAAYRLPSGRHGISPAKVAENQRWRLIGAAAEAMAESGYGRVSTQEITDRAGVSSSTYYAHFENRDACLLAAFEMVADSLDQAVLASCRSDLTSRRRVAAAVESVIASISAEPALTALLGVDLQAGVPAVGAARVRLVRRLAALLVEAGQGDDGFAAPRRQLTAECLVGGALAIVSAGLLAEAARSPAEVAAELGDLLMACYPADVSPS
jgi:AcrR family transcriptional regulator